MDCVLFLIAKADNEPAQHGMDMGAVGYVTVYQAGLAIEPVKRL